MFIRKTCAVLSGIFLAACGGGLTSPSAPTPELTWNSTNANDFSATKVVPTRPDLITICHATGSATNPYTEIVVEANGLNGHGQHPGDIIPAPAGGCGITAPAPTVTLGAVPSIVPTGTGSSGTSTATWSSTDATTCIASTSKIINSGTGASATSDWTGARTLSGSLPVNFTGIGPGDDIDFVLTLTCAGPGGTAAASTTVNVYNDTPN